MRWHVAIGLGANLGDPLAALRAAIDAIDALADHPRRWWRPTST